MRFTPPQRLHSLLVGIGVSRSTTVELPIWGKFLILEITTDIQVQGEISLSSLNQALFIIACRTLLLPEFVWVVF